MRILGAASSVVFVIALVVIGGAPVYAAEKPGYNTQLEVRGVVMPAQHVVIDEHGNILEILSNTDKDIVPNVYLGEIIKASRRPMTPEIYAQYRQIVPVGSSHVGMLYKRPPEAVLIPLGQSESISPERNLPAFLR